MIGDRYTRWVVVGEDRQIQSGAKKKLHCLCRCDCGVERVVRLDGLMSGASTSCGCILKESKISDEERKARKSAYQSSERGRMLGMKRVSKYRNTEKGRITRDKAALNDRISHPDRMDARTAVSNAIASGLLLKQPCEKCGDMNVHAHHDDYSKKLSVRWLCVKHHVEHHLPSKPSLINVGVSL